MAVQRIKILKPRDIGSFNPYISITGHLAQDCKKNFPHLSPECSIMLGMGNRLGGRGARCQIHIHNLLMSTILLTVNFTVIMFQQLL